MWVSQSLLSLFSIGKQVVDDLKLEVATLKSENAILKGENISHKVNNDFLRVKVNQLEAERAQLIEKAYGIHVPVPELVKVQPRPTLELSSALFEDMGDRAAKDLGLPVFTN